MAAAKGNKYAAGCETNGAPFSFKTPEDAKMAAEKYFEWCDKHPIYKNEALKGGERAGEIIKIPTQRPYLIEGFCNHAGISLQTFYNYESKETYKDYFEIFAWIRNVIYTQNLENGYVGGYDSGLVARKLGLVDKKEMEAKVQTGAINVTMDGKILRASNVSVRNPIVTDNNKTDE